jgi:hypothetical protein
MPNIWKDRDSSFLSYQEKHVKKKYKHKVF